MTELGNLAYPDLEELAADVRPLVVLLPVGAVEPHGPHAPLATDILISQEICERVARELERDPHLRVLVLPALAYGVTRYAAAFRGAVSIGEETLRALVVEICESLAVQGLGRIVVVNSHLEPEHRRALREAVDEVGGAVRLFDPTRRQVASKLPEEFRLGASHAGSYETSLVLAADPRLVRPERMAALEANMVDMPAEIAAGRTDFVAMGMGEAYCGAPAEASAEEGEKTFGKLAELVAALVREVAAC